MATPALTLEVWLERKKKIEEALALGYAPNGISGPSGRRGAIYQAAKALKIAHQTLHSNVSRAEELGYPAVDWAIFKRPSNDPIEQRTPDAVRTRNQIADLKKRLNEALKKIADLEDIRSSVFGLAPDKLTIPAWQSQNASSKSKSRPEIATLFTSDFQVGEVIRSEELEYSNDYDPAIFAERYRRLINTSIKLLQRESPEMNYPGFVYLRGGDAISGSIHADLAETQSLTCVEQTQLVAEEEIKGLEELLKAVPKITVYSVPGNHDRTTPKPRSKRYVALSYDQLCIWTIEKYFSAKGEKRIQFFTPPSGDAYYQVFDTHYLLTHGDRIGSRGGQGFVGPAATLARGIIKCRQQAARMGRPVNYVLTGHFHVAMSLPNGIANGCLAGFSEYAKNELRAEPEPPTQTIFWTHPKWGLTTMRRIRVDHD
jgi:hypothetical protein